jgi:hypothetical protein
MNGLCHRFHNYEYPGKAMGLGAIIADDPAGSRWIQRLSVEKPILKSAATCLRCKPLVNAAHTASLRNSGVGFCAMIFPLGGKIPVIGAEQFRDRTRSI